MVDFLFNLTFEVFFHEIWCWSLCSHLSVKQLTNGPAFFNLRQIRCLIKRNVKIKLRFGACLASHTILFLSGIVKLKRWRSINFLNCIESLWWLSVSLSKNTAGSAVLFLFHELMNSFKVSVLCVLIGVMIVTNTNFTNDLCEHSLVVSGWTGSQLWRNTVEVVTGFLHNVVLRFDVASVGLSRGLIKSLVPFRIGPLWFLVILDSKAFNYFWLLILAENTFSWEVLLSVIMWVAQAFFIWGWIVITGEFRHELRGLLLVLFDLFGFTDDLEGLLRGFRFSWVNDASFGCFFEELVYLLSDFLLLSVDRFRRPGSALFHIKDRSLGDTVRIIFILKCSGQSKFIRSV